MRCGGGSCAGGKATLICRFENGRSCCHHERRACPVAVEKYHVSFVIFLVVFSMFPFGLLLLVSMSPNFFHCPAPPTYVSSNSLHLVSSSSSCISLVSPSNTNSLPLMFLLFHLSSILSAPQNISTNLSRVDPLSRERIVVGTHNGDCVCDVVSMSFRLRSSLLANQNWTCVDPEFCRF